MKVADTRYVCDTCLCKLQSLSRILFPLDVRVIEACTYVEHIETRSVFVNTFILVIIVGFTTLFV